MTHREPPVPAALQEDRQAREQAVDPRRSWLVRAPAGSGKTELLIQRFLALLATVEEPEQVLAITFTVKAAGEMRERILAALRLAQAQAPEAPHAHLTWTLARAVVARDARRGWHLAATPARLRIQTIDALCMYVATRNPLAADLVGLERVTPRPQLLYQRAAAAVFDHWASRAEAPGAGAGDGPGAVHGAAAPHDSVPGHGVGPGPAAGYAAAAGDPAAAPTRPGPEATLLTHLDGDLARATRLLGDMLGARDRWLRRVVGGVAGLARTAWRSLLEAGLAAVVHDALVGLRDSVPGDLRTALPPIAAAAADRLAGSADDEPSPILACAGLRALPGVAPQDLAAWRGLAELLLTRQGQPRVQVTARQGFPADDERAAPHREALRELLARLDASPGFVRRLGQVRGLPDPAYTQAQWAVVDALTRLLPLAVAHLKGLFAERGEVDFTEVAHGALRVLDSAQETADAAGESLPSDTALVLDEQIRHVLVDEFQDTSHPQLQLLERLTAGWEPGDGRTVFLVGDPMQSIYRFRDAEVQLFSRVQRDGLGALTLPLLRLRRNFRSHPTLVDWVSATMQAVAVAGEEATDAPSFEISVAGLPAAAFDAQRTAPRVTLTLTQGTAAREAEVAWLVPAVRTALAEAPGTTVAILVRAREQLAHLLPALRAAGLRFVGVDIEPLRDMREVRDVHALTRALWHFGDRAAWLAVLRAPWCGLTLSDLHALVRDQRGRTIWDCMVDETARSRLSEDGRRRLARVKGVLADAWRQRGRTSLRDAVEGAWSAMGGAASLAGEQALENVHRYFTLLDSVDDGGRLSDPRLLEEGLDGLYAQPDPKADGRLQIMTMHRAKGLEFDVVFVPGLCATPRPAPRALLEIAEIPLREGGRGAETPATALVLGPIGTRAKADPIGDWLRRRERRLDQEEALRLAYVALTRARRALHLCGEVRPGAAHEEAMAPAGSLLALLAPGLRATGLWPAPSAQQQAAAGSTAPATGPSRAVAADAAPAPSRAVAADAAPAPSPAVAADAAAGRAVGTPAGGVALVRLPSDWSLKRMPVPDVIRVPRPAAAEEGELRLPREGASEIAREVGRVTHWVLTQLAARREVEPMPVPGARLSSALSRRIIGALQRAGMRDASLLEAASRTMEAVRNTLGDARGRWALGEGGEEVKAGLSLSGWLDGRAASARVDLTFRQGEDCRWLVELRTAGHEGSDTEGFIAREMAAAGPPLALARRLARRWDGAVRWRAGIYFPLLGAWRELEEDA